MSSTKRGNKRIINDFFETPLWVTEILLNNYTVMNTSTVLEPAVGKGKIANVLKEHGLNPVGIDINPEFKPDIVADFLNWEPDKKYWNIITNPPFMYAAEYINKCLSLTADGGTFALLLRLNYLESQKRYNLWKHSPPTRIIVLSERPAFTSNGTDSCAYAWFIWTKGSTGPTTIRVASKSELNLK